MQPTIIDLLEKAEGEIEVIISLDGYWPDPCLKGDDRLKLIHLGKSKGMRNAINCGVAIARGKYIMKIDGHCLLDKGYDVKLIKESKPNLVQVPRRKRLDAENWCEHNVGKPDIDYMYLSYPDDPNDRGGTGFHGRMWNNKNKDKSLEKDKIVDCISAQGSCYFLEKKYYEELELLDEINYGPFGSEFQEVGFKCWLSGGRVVRNKNTFYCHLHKGKKYGRGYFLSKTSMNQATAFTNKWVNFQEAWSKQTKPLNWLIKHFWPMPGWTEEKYEALFGEKYDQ